jgi:hypothetical protein
MHNLRKSPLYFYLKTFIDYRQKKNIGLASIQKVKTMVDNLLTFCCLPAGPYQANMFVQGAYILIKEMDRKDDIPKLKAVQAYLANVISCCN